MSSAYNVAQVPTYVNPYDPLRRSMRQQLLETISEPHFCCGRICCVLLASESRPTTDEYAAGFLPCQATTSLGLATKAGCEIVSYYDLSFSPGRVVESRTINCG
jgi:hypothetical protein